MNIVDINSMIEEFENSEASLSNIRNLSSLYNVRKHLKKSADTTEKELSDILPSYLSYIDAKRKYQRNETTAEFVFVEMQYLAREIKEFLLSLYKCTDTKREKDILDMALKDIR